MTESNITTSYTLVPETLALLPKLRKSTGLTNAQIITEGVNILEANPSLVADLPEQPYGSGKKVKVFNLPESTVAKINALAERSGRYRTHVVDVAIRAYTDSSSKPLESTRGHGQQLLALISDEDLMAEVARRGL